MHDFHPQLVLGTWSWDAALAHSDPNGYQRILDRAIRTLLTPGDGVLGVIFLQMPPFRPAQISNPRTAGIAAWNKSVQKAASMFPGRVMYLPVASSLEIDGRYTSWLPANRNLSSPPKTWVRIRTSDELHLCPPGITRYAGAELSELTELFHLPLLGSAGGTPIRFPYRRCSTRAAVLP